MGYAVYSGSGWNCILRLTTNEKDGVDETGEVGSMDLLGEPEVKRIAAVVGGYGVGGRSTCTTFSRGLCRRLQGS